MEGEALDSVYVYGKLEMGAFSKTIFVRPLRAMPSITTQSSALGQLRGSFIGGVSNVRGSFSTSVSSNPATANNNNNNNNNSGIRGSISVPTTNLTSSTRASVSFTGENLPALAAFPLSTSDLALDPLLRQGTSPEDNLASIEQKLCMLPGLSDMAAFRECLTSATFVLQVT